MQRCAAVLGTLRAETQAYLAAAAPHHANPDVKERSDRLVAIWTELWAQWSDPACTRPRAAGESVGMAPAWAAVVVVVVGGVAYAVSEVGSAWAISTTADADVALEQVRLQRKELDARVTASLPSRPPPPTNATPSLTPTNNQHHPHPHTTNPSPPHNSEPRPPVRARRPAPAAAPPSPRPPCGHRG